MDSKWTLQRAVTFSLPAGTACASLKKFALEVRKAVCSGEGAMVGGDAGDRQVMLR